MHRLGKSGNARVSVKLSHSVLASGISVTSASKARAGARSIHVSRFWRRPCMVSLPSVANLADALDAVCGSFQRVIHACLAEQDLMMFFWRMSETSV